MEELFSCIRMRCNGVTSILKTQNATIWAEQGKEDGECPSRRCTVHILGDARAGKTSLRKNLMGEDFNFNEPPTDGIKKKMCHIKTVDKKWQEKKIDASNEYDEAMSWYIVRRAFGEFNNFTHSLKYAEKDFLSVVVVAFILLLLLLYCHLVLPSAVYNSTAPKQGASSHCPVDSTCFYIPRTLSDISHPYDLWNFDGIHVIVFLFCLPKLIGSLAPLLVVYAFVISTFLTTMTCHTGTMCLLPFLFLAYGFLTGLGFGKILLVFIIIWIFQADDDQLIWEIQSSSEILRLLLLLGITFGLAMAVLIMIFLINRDEDQLQALICVIIISMISAIYATNRLQAFVFGSILGWIVFIAYAVGNQLQIKVPSIYQSVIEWIPYPIFMFGYFVICLLKGELVHTWFLLHLHLLCLFVCYPFNVTLFFKEPILNHAILDDLYKKMKLVIGHVWFPNLPIWLSISDYAGQEIYYNTHHTFMTPDTTFVLAFDITGFVKNESRDSQYKRVLFWLRSIRTHSKAPVVLVATHADLVNPRLISEIHNYFKVKLSTIDDSFMERIIWSDDKPFFAIDNKHRLSDDIHKLRATIWTNANRSVLYQSLPIRWLPFLRFIDDMRLKSYNAGSSAELLMTVERAGQKFDSCDSKDFKAMLKYFDWCGDIFFESEDEFLSQYVLLDKQLIVDAAEAIHTIPEKRNQGRLMYFWELLSERGLLHFKLAGHMFREHGNDDFVKVVLCILDHKGLICRVNDSELTEDNIHMEDNYHNYKYMVLSMLPNGAPEIPLGIPEEHIHLYYFDFGDYMPDALFTRLLARCQTQSQLQYLTDEQRYLYRQGGEFNLESTMGSFYYWLHLYTDHPTQNLIAVSVKAASADSNAFNLLRYLWQFVEDLRKQQFPEIQFHCGIACPHSPPHQDSKKQPLHVLREAHDNQPSFPDPSKIFTCRGRDIPLDASRQFNPQARQCISAATGSVSDSSVMPNVNGNKNLTIENSGTINFSGGWLTHNQVSSRNLTIDCNRTGDEFVDPEMIIADPSNMIECVDQEMIIADPSGNRTGVECVDPEMIIADPPNMIEPATGESQLRHRAVKSPECNCPVLDGYYLIPDVWKRR